MNPIAFAVAIVLAFVLGILVHYEHILHSLREEGLELKWHWYEDPGRGRWTVKRIERKWGKEG